MKKFVTVKRLVEIFILLSLILIGIFLITDKEQIMMAVTNSQPIYLLMGLGFCLLSYFFLFLGFLHTAQLVDLKITKKDLIKTAYLSNVINNLISLPILTTYPAKYAMLEGKGERKSKIASFVLIQSQLNNVGPAFFLPLSIIYIIYFQSTSIEGRNLAVDIAILLLILLGINALVFVKWVRKYVLDMAKKLLFWINKEHHTEKITILGQQLTTIVETLKANPRTTAEIVVLALLQWISLMFVLGACFLALGVAMPLPVLMAGFFIGIVIGFTSIVPGGIGIQEVSMAGVFAFLGYDVHLALLAAVLFRIIYYFLPFLPLLFYRDKVIT